MNNISIIGVSITLAVYILILKVNKIINKSYFNVLAVSIIVVIIILSVLNIDVDTYNKSATYLTKLLGPLTVCLAVPLYRKLDEFKPYLPIILIGITVGVTASFISVYVIGKLVGLSEMIVLSLYPKTVTVAISTILSEQLGGNVAITVGATVITGITGSVLGEKLVRLFKIKSPIAQGVAIGTSSHVVGTTKALELGEQQGAASSIAIGIAGIVAVIVGPIVINILKMF